MPVTPIESNVGLFAQAKQLALGTPTAANDASVKRLRLVDGGLKAVKEIDTEPYVDGQVFPDATPFVTRLGGDAGSVSVQAQTTSGAFLFAQVIGADVVTGSADPWTHTISSGNLQGAYQTMWQQTGSSSPINTRFSDALVSKLTWRVGQDQKVARITQDVRAIKTATWVTTMPTATDEGTDPYLWSEVVGQVSIGGTAMAEADGETMEIDRKLDDHLGDNPAPVAFVPTAGEITRSVSAIVSNNTLPEIKQALWGSATPTDGTELSASIRQIALNTKYVRSASRSIEIQTPKVIVDIGDFDFAPQADGGKISVTFGGRCRPNGGTPAVTVIAKTGESAAYV